MWIVPIIFLGTVDSHIIELKNELVHKTRAKSKTRNIGGEVELIAGLVVWRRLWVVVPSDNFDLQRDVVSIRLPTTHLIQSPGGST